jgi:hypothetical protein
VKFMNRHLAFALLLGFATPALMSAPAAAQLPEGDDGEDDEELTPEEKKKLREKIEAEEKARIEAEVRERVRKEAAAKEAEASASAAERRAAEEARAAEAARLKREEELRAKALSEISARKRAEEEEKARIRAEIEAKVRAEEEAKARAAAAARAETAAVTPAATAPVSGLTPAQRAEAEKRAREQAEFEAQVADDDRKLKEKLEKGRSVVAGVDAMHSWMVTFTEVPDTVNGGRKSVSSSNFFLSAGPRLGFFVGPEGMEVNLAGGMLWRQIPVGADGETAVEFDGYVGPGINFHIPMSPRLFFVMGADTAFYWGSGTRPLDLDNDPTTPAFDAETDALGFYGNIHAGPGYFINPVFQVRATLEGSALFGFETQKGLPPIAGQPPQADEQFFSPAYNTGIRIGIFAYF